MEFAARLTSVPISVLSAARGDNPVASNWIPATEAPCNVVVVPAPAYQGTYPSGDATIEPAYCGMLITFPLYVDGPDVPMVVSVKVGAAPSV